MACELAQNKTIYMLTCPYLLVKNWKPTLVYVIMAKQHTEVSKTKGHAVLKKFPIITITNYHVTNYHV